MKKRRVLIIAACVFVAAVLAVVLWPGEREPEYQGKKLSQWLEYAPGIPPQIVRLSDGTLLFDAQIDAVQHMGTNGASWLVRWVRYEPAKWRLKLRDSVASAPKAWRARCIPG